VKKVLKEKTAVKAGEVIDASVMSRKALRSFIEAQIADAKMTSSPDNQKDDIQSRDR